MSGSVGKMCVLHCKIQIPTQLQATDNGLKYNMFISSHSPHPDTFGHRAQIVTNFIV